MLIFRGGNWSGHRPWLLVSLAIAGTAMGWYGFEAIRAGRLPGGSSLPGLVFGIAGGLIIVFEMLLWPRKKFRLARVGRAKTWMKAHIWLGLLSVPLLVMHSGFHWWGGSIATVLMFEFLAVVASGVWGLAFQQVLPRAMMENVPAEAILSQITPILGQYLDEAGRLVRMACGVEEPEATTASTRVGADRKRTDLVIGAVRRVGISQGRTSRSSPTVRRLEGAESLLEFFETVLSPYLAARTGKGSPLASAKQSARIFRNVRSWVDPSAHGVVDRLEDLSHRRRQFDLQVRLHSWLHGWLCIHLPLSFSMFIIMIIHVYYALRFL